MEVSENSDKEHMNERKDNEEEPCYISADKVEKGVENLENLSKRQDSNTCVNPSDSLIGSNRLLEIKPKKREFSSKMESQPDESSCKLIKLNCDSTSNGCDYNSNGSIDSTPDTSLFTQDSSAENTSDDKINESELVSMENTEESTTDVTNRNSESSTSQCTNDCHKSETTEEKDSSESKRSSSPSTSSESSESDVNTYRFSVTEENEEFSDDNSPLDSSISCDSSSSSDSDFTSMFSSFDDDIFMPNDGSVTSGEEHNSETNEDKNPSVLKKTLPADKFSFTKEIILRQFSCGDSKQRRFSKFDSKMYGSRRMIERLKLYVSLNKHNGCVNAVSFNETGNLLISGADDRHVCVWNWAKKQNLLYFYSGHVGNVFQAKFLLHSGDTKLITCGQDSQIRMCLLDESGLKSTSLITKHNGGVHKIAMQPQLPNCFLSAGEDGVVHSIDVRESNTYCKKLLKIPGQSTRSTLCLYSIHCNPIKNYEFIVCGSSDKIFLHDQRNISKKRQNPVKEFRVGSDLADRSGYYLGGKSLTVTCAVYNYNGTEIVASYNDNDVFLFNVEDPTRYVFRYDGHRNFATIKGVNFFGPRSEYVISGSDCGYIYFWDKKSEAIVQWLKGDKDIVNCLEPHPSFPILASSGLESDVKIWMPIENGFDEEGNEKEIPFPAPPSQREFHKIVKKNSYYKLAGSSHDDLGVSLFYFMASGWR